MFALRDFKMCEYILMNETSEYSTFLKHYSVFLVTFTFLIQFKLKLSKSNDSSTGMTILNENMAKHFENGKMDAFSLYLF